MKETFKIDGVTLKYGDAQFTFYNIKLLELYDRPEPSAALHAHTYYELHFLTKGEYEFSSTDKKVKLSAGNFLIIPPQLTHYSAVTHSSFDSIVMQFQLERTNGKKGMYSYFENSLICNAFKRIKASEELINSVKELRNTDFLNSIEAVCFRHAKLTDIIYRMFRCINGFAVDGQKAAIGEDKSDILFLIDHMVTSRTYTLNDIAEKTGYSTRNISRLISSIYKMPLSKLKRKYSLDTAKKMLESDEHTIEEIAVLSGFKNSCAMRNAFRKYEGLTPTEYKNQTCGKEKLQ